MNIRNLLRSIILLSSMGMLVACGSSSDDTAITDEYKVEFIPDTTPVREGKSSFQLRITNLLTGQPAENLDVSLMPMMYMATHDHSTPHEGVTEAGNGLYDATVYYLMPSSMNGTPMGQWEIKVMIGGMMGEVTYFYPDVMMAMGGNAKAKLLGQADMIYNMMLKADEPRPYYVFKESLTGTNNNHTFNLFLAAKEDMMNFPAIDDGVILNSGSIDYELAVTSVTVEVCADDPNDLDDPCADSNNWVTAVNNGAGHFSASGLTGMSSGVAAEIYVKVTVNGEQKTTDGSAPEGDGSNDYGTFSVTPA